MLRTKKNRPPFRKLKEKERKKQRARPSRCQRTAQGDRAQAPQEDRELPLVEHTNALPLDCFRSAYIPSTDQAFKIPLPARKQAETDTNDHQEETTYTLDIHTAQSIPPADFEACFALIEATSSNAYDSSSMGWSPAKKSEEMKLPDMRYLVVRRARSERQQSAAATAQEGGEEGQGILGFCSFMVTYEDGKEVIYCYEIHLSGVAQGCGLGRKLISTLEDIGGRIGLEKVMLTVFKSNGKAIGFYERLGFGVDEFSPQPRVLRNGAVKELDYLILSKGLRDRTIETKMEEQ